MTEPDERAAWLALLFGGGLKRQVAKSVLQQWCVVGNRPLAELRAMDVDGLSAALELDAAFATSLLGALEQAPSWAERLQQLEAQGTTLVLRSESAYPDVLAQHLPEGQLPYAFFARGDLALLAEPTLSLQGAAQPSSEALQAAQDLAQALAREGQVLVGGQEVGIDRLALETANRAGGGALWVLGQGLGTLNGLTKQQEHDITSGRLLLLSPYWAGQAVSPVLLQARLPLITALSEMLVLFEPRSAPREWPGYAESRARGLQALVWAGPQGAPQAWLTAGALPFGDAEAACGLMGQAIAVPLCEPTAASAETEEPELYQSPEYADADAALEALRRSGAVPPALARRLRQTGWPGGDGN